MNLFLKIFGCLILTVFAAAYLTFLFCLPRAIDLNTFKPDIQKLAKEQGNVDIDFKNLHIITDPLLRAGIALEDISVNLPDGSELFKTDAIKGKISLPHLLLLTVKVVGVEVDNPFINLETTDGIQLKVLQLVEDIINTQIQAKKAEERKEVAAEQETPFYVSMIKIKVPDVKINDYKLFINDLKNRHTLTLSGEELHLGYFNGKIFKLKTNAELYSDNDKNVIANIVLDTFIPPSSGLDADDDEAVRVELPKINPVQMYRDFNLQSDINMNLKVRNSDKSGLCLGGYINMDKIAMTVSGYNLPESFLKFKFRGGIADMDTDFYITPDENIKLKGLLSYADKPFMNLKILTSKIYFNDVIMLVKAFADTLHIKNDLAEIKGNGYVNANADIKTNFKTLKSTGGIVVRDGAIVNEKIGLGFKGIKANILLADNLLKITDTHLFVNDSEINIEGNIDEDNIVDISILAEKLPLPKLFTAFAPEDLKKSYNLQEGDLSLDVKIYGELKNALSSIKLNLNDFVFTDKKNTMAVRNEKAAVDLTSNFKTIGGKIENNNFTVNLQPSNSVITNDLLTININEDNIDILPANIRINSQSAIKIKGSIQNYMKNPYIDFGLNGKINACDIKQLAYPFGDIYLNAEGTIPVKLALNGNSKRQHLIFQTMADKINHITPVDIQSIQGKQSILQAKVDFKGDRLRVKDTGLFYKDTPSVFGEDLSSNMDGTKEVFALSTTITGLHNPVPFINLLKITMPEELTMGIYAFKNSLMYLKGGMIVFGNIVSPSTKGDFRLHDLSIPDLLTTLETFDLHFLGKKLDINIKNLNLNGSDIGMDTTIELIPSNVINISDLSVKSQKIDLDKLLELSTAAMKYVPQMPANSSAALQEPADIPINIKRGNIDLQEIKTGNITAYNTTGDISLNRNVFYLNKLGTNVFDGDVSGDVTANLVSMDLGLRLHGENFDVENTLFELMQMKDTLTGTLAFDTDLTMNGAAPTQDEQMKSINGNVDFVIKEGQLGPFGKLENLILAENIRESEFFKTTIGTVINSVTSVNTSHFNELTGHLLFNDGILTIEPITSFGDVLCMHIGGIMDLISGEADMKIRGKLGSTVSNMLGPLAAVNPINLAKVTPGMDILAAKAFQFFCEEITQEEMDAIPDFGSDFNEMSTTKFQVVLKGDTAKPLTLVKSFKWLALASEIEQAQGIVSELPDPEPTEEEIEAAKDTERLQNKFWRFLYRFMPEKRNLLKEAV